MSHFNFLPSIEEVKFIQSQTGDSNIDNIYEFDQVFELAMEFTIGGLKYLKNPLRDNEYIPFYLNTITYTQRGTRDTVIHGLISEYFDDKYSNTNNQKRFVTLTKFRPYDERDDGTVFDFIQNIYFVEIFITNKMITTKEELAEMLKSKNQQNVLFKTKIPYVNKQYFEISNNGGFENGWAKEGF